MIDLNLVKTEVTVAGSPCYFKELTLHQSFNNHHRFEIKVDYEELEGVWLENPTKIIQLIGENVGITMEHRQTHEVNLFNGIITNVSMNGIHVEQNYITIIGTSPTIKLDGTPSMDSFMDLTLENIVNEAIQTSGNGAEVTVNPIYKGKIDYICQYDETAFDFFNRLSWLYGEWFFYDGTTTYFGNPNLTDVTSIEYGKEMSYLDLTANLIPPKVNRIEYLNHDNNETNADAPDTVPGVRGYIKVALDQSKKIYTSDAVRRLEASILSKKELDDLVKVDKYRMVSQMLVMKGTSDTCKIKIGRLISINLPEKMRAPLKHVETFLVTELVHTIGQDGKYYNTFTAIPSEMENIPMQPIKAPIALPQVAWVKNNADVRDRGRIKVQLQWQKKLNKTTNWIRVQTPDAGSSDKVASNRGFVFIPEVDDLVMINFENGDPNRPYVTGSMFRENKGAGGGHTNKSKNLTTRMGSTMTLDESDGSVYLKDQAGSDSKITLDGNQNITATAGKSITLTVGKASLEMLADGTITLKSGDNNTFIMTPTTSKLETPDLVTTEAKVVNTWGVVAIGIYQESSSIDMDGDITMKGGDIHIN